MAFTPIQYDSGKLVKIPMATTQTVVKGDSLSNADASGYYTVTAADDNLPPSHIAMETVTTTANGQMVLAIRTPGVVFEADCEDAPALADRGTYCDLASKSTLDPDSSADDVFFIEEIIGTIGTSTKVRGWFMQAVPQQTT